MKIKITIVILLITLLAGCSDKVVRCYVCDSQEKIKVSEFISANMLPANNMSDEEMEDVIITLRETAIMTICKQSFVTANYNSEPRYELLEKDTSKTYYFWIY